MVVVSEFSYSLFGDKIMQYNFSGRNDLVKFIKEIQAQGLYACLRIGPYIESEWTYGYANYACIWFIIINLLLKLHHSFISI